jgi:hypothetical protein
MTKKSVIIGVGVLMIAVFGIGISIFLLISKNTSDNKNVGQKIQFTQTVTIKPFEESKSLTTKENTIQAQNLVSGYYVDTTNIPKDPSLEFKGDVIEMHLEPYCKSNQDPILCTGNVDHVYVKFIRNKDDINRGLYLMSIEAKNEESGNSIINSLNSMIKNKEDTWACQGNAFLYNADKTKMLHIGNKGASLDEFFKMVNDTKNSTGMKNLHQCSKY